MYIFQKCTNSLTSTPDFRITFAFCGAGADEFDGMVVVTLLFRIRVFPRLTNLTRLVVIPGSAEGALPPSLTPDSY